MEDWRPIEDAPGYEVSSEGRVRSLERIDALGRPRPGCTLQPSRTPQGYAFVGLWVDGKCKRRTVHRLVLETFVGKKPPKHEARHLNGERTDNRLTNLAWGTRAENYADRVAHGTDARGEKHGNARLTADDVRAIRADPRTQSEIAEDYGLSQSYVSQIRRCVKWRHV